MYDENAVEKILKQASYLDLTWNNYPEAIGDGRMYIGHWDKKSTARIKWRGFGTIIFSDKSKYQGQTENGLFHGMGRMTHANGDVY